MRCEKCGVQINGTPVCCPLCQSSLCGEPEPNEQEFPFMPVDKAQRRFLQMVGFISLIVCVACVIINMSIQSGYWWSLFVVGGIISFWASFSTAVIKRKNLPKTIIWQVVLLSSLCIVWDMLLGFRRWSVNFVTPLLCTAAILAVVIIGKVMKMKITDYMVYILIDLFLCLSALFLLIFGVVTIPLPSLICVGASVVSLGGLIIFRGKDVISELQRRMHL